MNLLHCNCALRWSEAATLILRVSLGLIFFMHGYQKVFSMGLPAVPGFLSGLGFPMPVVFAYVLAYGEFVFGALLILGLFTHWAAKFGTIVAVVALFTVHISNDFFISNGGIELILLILAASLFTLVNGGGKYSLDAVFFKNQSGSMSV